MSFALRTPKAIKQTDIKFDTKVLEASHCGLFRAPLHLAGCLMPTMAELIDSAPVKNREMWELDVKVHMLMPGQFPCIPNWHTDNVPRDEGGLRFDLVDTQEEGQHPPMFLWLSDGPETEFLERGLEMPAAPGSNQELARFLNGAGLGLGPLTQRLQPNVWWSMDQQTPHRGTRATQFGWRVFARLTHKSIAPARPVNSVIRRHAQVYLDAANFGW